MGSDSGVVLVGEKVTSIARGGTASTSAADALTALGAAPLVSPTLSGTPTVPTASVGTNTTQAASTAFVQANRGDRYLTTSTTTWTLGNGTQAFTVDAGLSYTPTQDVTVVYNSLNHAHGSVVSYSGTTLTVDFTHHTGSGTYSQWTLNVGGLSIQEGALLQANNLSDVANAATALINLGGRFETSVVPVLYGGTGATNAQSALNTLAGAVTQNQVLAGDGTNVTLRTLTAADVPSAAQIGALATSDIIAISNGGTGATSAASALTSLGAQAALTSAAPLAISKGGTGAITGDDALKNLGSSLHYVTLRTGNAQTPLAVSGSYTATWSTASTTVTLSTGNTSLFSQGNTFGAGGLAGTAIISITNSTQFVVSSLPSTTQATAAAITVFATTPTTFTYAPGVQPTNDGYLTVVGDVIAFSGQTPTPTNGPWVCAVAGAVGVSQVMTRPAWFTGNAAPILLQSLKGNTSQGSIGAITSATGSNNDIQVGLQGLGAHLIYQRANVPTLASNTFSGRQTLAANTTTVNPISFQTSTTFLSALTSNAVEWVTDRLYITAANAASRFQVAYTSDIPALTTAAPAALATAASAGISTQAARADHVHALPLPAINSTALTAYTLALSDNNATVQTTASSAVAITIPLNSSIPLPVGTQVLVYQSGTGQVTFAGASGVTLRSSGSKTKTAAQYALATLLKVATNEWVLGGDITT
jgi:hypothetical protein